jgi:splicing factor U2AF subunit
MADYLASIFGTEKDKVNCSFYFKIGACRHGEKCSKVHNKPTFSQTVLLKNLYLNPLNVSHQSNERPYIDQMTEEELQQHFDDIFEELFIEMESQYGEIEEMNICDNLSEHLAGNTYVKFRYEEDSEKACQQLNNRWFNGKPIYAELSPVTDFHEACCRQYQMGECPRGGFCNFMHLKPISNSLRRKLYSVKYSKKRREEEFDEAEGGPVGFEYGAVGGPGGYESPDYSPTLMSSMGGGGSYYNEISNGMNGGGGGGQVYGGGYMNNEPRQSNSNRYTSGRNIGGDPMGNSNFNSNNSYERRSRSRSPSSKKSRGRRNGRH